MIGFNQKYVQDILTEYDFFDDLFKKNNINDVYVLHINDVNVNGVDCKCIYVQFDDSGREKAYTFDNERLLIANGLVHEIWNAGFIAKSLFFNNGLLHHNTTYAYQEHYLSGISSNTIRKYYLDGYFLTSEEFWNKQKNTEYADKVLAIMLAGK